MSQLTLEEFEEFHESRESLRDDGEASLYCNACGQWFEPTELTSQKDDWCVCATCADAIADMCAGRVA